MYNTIHTENEAILCEVPLDYLIFTIFRITPAIRVFKVVGLPERERMNGRIAGRISLALGATLTYHLACLYFHVSH